MSDALVEVMRGDFVESVHRGAAVVADASGRVLEAWGEPGRVVLPRSAAKPLQALALVESGAADAAGLGPERLALACASHAGGAAHAGRVRAWLGDLGLDEGALVCGGHEPEDRAERDALIRAGRAPGRAHDNCSGKHAGFLTLAARLGDGGAGGGYADPDGPTQRAVAAAIAEATGDAPDLGHALDGCGAPNFAVTLGGLAAGMARMADPSRGFGPGARAAAAGRLLDAMTAHPDLVSGEGRPCTAMMRALGGRVAVKTGAEGVYVAALRTRGLGVAVKIDDGAGRAAVVALAALLTRLGEDADALCAFRTPVLRNRGGVASGRMRPAADLR